MQVQEWQLHRSQSSINQTSPSIETTTNDSQKTWSILTMVRIIINKIQVIGPEIYTPKRRIVRNSKSSWPTTSERSIQIWCNRQHTAVSIITSSCGCCPENIGGVERVVLWVGGLAEEISRAMSSHIELFSIASGGDQDYICVTVVWQGRDSYGRVWNQQLFSTRWC